MSLASFEIAVVYIGGGMTQRGRMPLTKYGVTRLAAFDAAKNIEIRLKTGEERGYRFPISRIETEQQFGVILEQEDGSALARRARIQRVKRMR